MAVMVMITLLEPYSTNELASVIFTPPLKGLYNSHQGIDLFLITVIVKKYFLVFTFRQFLIEKV
jgi:hypothetical protein